MPPRALPMAGTEARPILIYDGECDLCRRAVTLLRSWDPCENVAVVAFQDHSAIAHLASRFPAVPALPALAAAMHLIMPDGRVFAGADAVPELVRLLPGKEWMRWFFSVPGARPLARRVYRTIAQRRHCVVRGGRDSFAKPDP